MSDQTPESSGKFTTAGTFNYAIAVSRWNSDVTNRLTEGALRWFEEHGVGGDQIFIARCPGAFELPLVVHKLASSGRYHAVIALGAVVRGDTPHFDYVAGGAARGIMQASLDTGVPCMFGVLTTDTQGQALARAGLDNDNKGYQAAQGAMEMAELLHSLSGRQG